MEVVGHPITRPEAVCAGCAFPMVQVRIENELTKYMMYTQGWGKVRGGDWVFARCKSRLWLPRELRSLGPTDVLVLHASRVSHFLPQTRRIIEFLEMRSSLHYTEHLDADTFPAS